MSRSRSGRIAGNSRESHSLSNDRFAGGLRRLHARSDPRSEAKPHPRCSAQRASSSKNQLYFWQSNYTVRIEGRARRRTRSRRSLSREIFWDRSQKPPVSEYLPAANIVAGTEKYLLNRGVDRPCSGFDSAKLGFDFSAEAATATYRTDGTPAHLLLVLYPTQHIAKKYADEMDSAQGSTTFRKRAGPLVAIVYGSRDEAMAASILDGVNHEFKVTWNEPQPGLGLGHDAHHDLHIHRRSRSPSRRSSGVSYGGLRVFVKIALSQSGLRSSGNDGIDSTQARSRSYRQADRKQQTGSRKL